MSLPERRDLIRATAREIASWAPVRPAYAVSYDEIGEQNGIGWRLPGTARWPEKVYLSPAELSAAIRLAVERGARIEATRGEGE